MTSLNLSAPHPTTLSASAFPTSADVYLCDKCGRDVTKHLHRGQAHVWKPIDPNRYQCRCGEKYLIGATEWDHLGEWERKGVSDKPWDSVSAKTSIRSPTTRHDFLVQFLCVPAGRIWLKKTVDIYERVYYSRVHFVRRTTILDSCEAKIVCC
jgi:hypothetical protein